MEFKDVFKEKSIFVPSDTNKLVVRSFLNNTIIYGPADYKYEDNLISRARLRLAESLSYIIYKIMNKDELPESRKDLFEKVDKLRVELELGGSPIDYNGQFATVDKDIYLYAPFWIEDIKDHEELSEEEKEMLEFLQELNKDIENDDTIDSIVNLTKKGINIPNKQLKRGFGKTVDVKVIQSGKTLEYSIIEGYEETYDDKVADTVAKNNTKNISKVLVGRGGRRGTHKPTKRLSMGAVISGSDKIYIEKSDTDGEEYHVNIMLDGSGSMFGIWDSSMDIIRMINHLPYIHGKIIITNEIGSVDFDMPVSSHTLSSFTAANGQAEGIQSCINKYKKEILKADITFCITDGHIEDGHVTEEQKKTVGSKLVGIVIDHNLSKNERLRLENDLSNHFDRYFVEENITKMVDLIKKKGRL